jgi:hypothetical protein
VSHIYDTRPTTPSWHHTLVSSDVLHWHFLSYYQGIPKLFLIFLYDQRKLRKRILNTEKTIRDLFSFCFLLSSSKRIFFRRLKRVFSAQGGCTEKSKTIWESPGNKEYDYVFKTFLWCLWRKWRPKTSNNPRFSVYDEIGCRWAWSCGWVRGLWHISGHTAQGEYVNLIPQGMRVKRYGKIQAVICTLTKTAFSTWFSVEKMNKTNKWTRLFNLFLHLT